MEASFIRVKVTGMTPLLMSRMPDNFGPTVGDAKVKAEASPKTQEEADSRLAEKSAYRMNGSGSQLWFPAQAFRSGLIQVAKEQRLPGPVLMRAGKKVKISMEALLSGSIGLDAETERALLVHPKTGEALTAYKVDVRSAVNHACHPPARVRVVRALVPEWACVVTFILTGLLLPRPEDVVEVMNLAGQIIGVGALKPKPPKDSPAKVGGWMGKYTAELAA